MILEQSLESYRIQNGYRPLQCRFFLRLRLCKFIDYAVELREVLSVSIGHVYLAAYY